MPIAGRSIRAETLLCRNVSATACVLYSVNAYTHTYVHTNTRTHIHTCVHTCAWTYALHDTLLAMPYPHTTLIPPSHHPHTTFTPSSHHPHTTHTPPYTTYTPPSHHTHTFTCPPIKPSLCTPCTPPLPLPLPPYSHYEEGGSSKLAVPTLDLEMDEILKSAMKKRQLPLSPARQCAQHCLVSICPTVAATSHAVNPVRSSMSRTALYRV